MGKRPALTVIIGLGVHCTRFLFQKKSFVHLQRTYSTSTFSCWSCDGYMTCDVTVKCDGHMTTGVAFFKVY